MRESLVEHPLFKCVWRCDGAFAAALVSTVRWILGSLAVGLMLLLIFRRMAGGISAPLELLPSLLFGVTLVAAYWALLFAVRKFANYDRQLAAQVIASALAVGCAAAVTFAESSTASLLAAWLPIAVGIGLSFERPGSLPESMVSAPVPVSSNEVRATVPGAAVEFPAPDEVASDDVIALDSALSEMAFADPAVTQQLVRRREANGSETVSGCLRAFFSAGERTVHLHVPFCPPLSETPACSAETIDGAAARVKVSQVLRQGARLEVRLDQVATEPTEVVVEFSTA